MTERSGSASSIMSYEARNSGVVHKLCINIIIVVVVVVSLGGLIIELVSAVLWLLVLSGESSPNFPCIAALRNKKVI